MCPGGSGRVQPLTNLRGRVGPLPKNLRPEASEALRLAEARVLRVLEALGGREAHSYVFYVSGRLQGGPAFNEANTPGGSPS